MKCELDLPKEIEKSVRSNKKGAVLFIDLDDFKHINDGSWTSIWEICFYNR